LRLESTNNIIKGLVFPNWGDGTTADINNAIYIGADSNQVLGCYIGVDVLGTTATGLSQRFGINIMAHSNIIGDGTAAGRNLISGNDSLTSGSGVNFGKIFVAAANNNIVRGNIIGLAADGATRFVSTQYNGVLLYAGSNNTIGGSLPGEGNVISGNRSAGIGFGGSSNTIIGNIIGPQADGVTYVTDNTQTGITISTLGGSGVIGGTTPGERNIISGNELAGIIIAGGGGTQIIGNYIGLAADGVSFITGSSQLYGVYSWIIAGSTTIEGNVISGNTLAGIGNVAGSYTIKGNIIGLQADGATYVTGNQQTTGIGLGTSGNVIGGTSPNERNIISGNETYGVYINGILIGNNKIKGNYIGSDTGLANISGADQDYGIYIANGFSSKIGGSAAGEANVIAFNTVDGVSIVVGNENLISRNLIYNTDVPMNKAINLNGAGNTNYPAPVITSVTATDVSGTSNASGGDVIELLLSDGGCINALQFLGTTTADGSGLWTISGLSLSPGDTVIAKARDASNNTSEFCPCAPLIPLPIELLSFTATPVDNPLTPFNKGDNQFVLTEWTTASEINTDFYTIERSQDGINWGFVNIVKAAGNSSISLSYSLTDEEPYTGTSYYRLKQVDINGSYEIYGPVAVRLEGVEIKGVEIISIYPNPAIDNIAWQVVSWEDTEVSVKVLDLLGREVIVQKESVQKGLNTFNIDVSGLSSSLYLLQIATKTGNYYSRKEFVVR